MPSSYIPGEFAPSPSTQGDTRRVLELQSDLFQKGRLDQEVDRGQWNRADVMSNLSPKDAKTYNDLLDKNMGLSVGEHLSDSEKNTIRGLETDALNNKRTIRSAELQPLKPYENSWQNRVIGEEVKQAALDGKTKLQFPTGETAAKIEGFSKPDQWRTNEVNGIHQDQLTPELIEPGRKVYSANQGNMIITDKTGPNSFKAVPARGLEMENDQGMYKYAWDKGYIDKETGDWNLDKAFADKNLMKQYADKYGEGFSIGNSMDREALAPEQKKVYDFYESTVGKHLQSNYGAKRITDPQGVSWWELPVKPEYASSPVHAFGGNIMKQALLQNKN